MPVHVAEGVETSVGGVVKIRDLDVVNLLRVIPPGFVAKGKADHQQDIEVTDYTRGLVLKSADGTRWRLTVSDTGQLVVTNLGV